MRKSIAILALALELAAVATATAAPAKNRAAQARAQAREAENGTGVSPERLRALHECSGRISSFKGYNGVNTPTSIYRSCMSDHGQPE